MIYCRAGKTPGNTLTKKFMQIDGFLAAALVAATMLLVAPAPHCKHEPGANRPSRTIHPLGGRIGARGI